MKLTRRELLKQLLLIGGLSTIVGFNFESFEQNISEFTPKQLEALKQVVNIELEGYFPYFNVENPLLYKITLKNGNVRRLIDYRDVQKKYGDIFAYYELPKIESSHPRYNNAVWND